MKAIGHIWKFAYLNSFQTFFFFGVKTISFIENCTQKPVRSMGEEKETLFRCDAIRFKSKRTISHQLIPMVRVRVCVCVFFFVLSLNKTSIRLSHSCFRSHTVTWWRKGAPVDLFSGNEIVCFFVINCIRQCDLCII